MKRINVRICRLALPRTHTLLRSFVPVLQQDSIPVYKPDYFGIFNPKIDCTKLSPAQKFNEDKLVLLELLPEFCMIGLYNISLPVRDEITTGFAEFARTKKPSLWLCFAAQVMLDSYHIVRYNRMNAAADLRLSGLRIKKTIDEYRTLSKTHPKPAFWHEQGEEEIDRIYECVKLFIEDDSLLHMRRCAEQDLVREKQSRGDNILFSRHLSLCGLLMFHLNLRMQTIGMALVTQWYDVQQLAFLYNLVQKIPEQELSWPDMELFIRIHGEDRIFFGDRPKDAAQSLNRLEIATGISSVANFASNPRRARGAWGRPDGKTDRRLEPTTKVVNMFRDRYQQSGSVARARSISSDDISKLLEKLTDAPSSKRGRDLQLATVRPMDLLERKWQNTHHLGALQLLALIRDKLSEEEHMLMFNYFAMHKRSMEMLRLIKVKEHHKFVQYFTDRYMPDDSMISTLVILIHHVARGSNMAGKQMGLQDKNSHVVSRIVMSCGDVMREYLKKNGDVGYKELQMFCRNKIQLSIEDNAAEKKEAEKKSMYVLALDEVFSPAQMESLKTGIPIA